MILLGNGDGTFKQGTNISVSNAGDIGLADFNGDHKPDIAISDYGSGKTWIYLGKGDGTFTLSDTQPYGGFPMVVGDFNADGKQDLLYAGGIGAGLFLGNGNGTLSAPIINSTFVQFYSLAVGDFYNSRI
jgi:FG-GAP-like repeat